MWLKVAAKRKRKVLDRWGDKIPSRKLQCLDKMTAWVIQVGVNNDAELKRWLDNMKMLDDRKFQKEDRRKNLREILKYWRPPYLTVNNDLTKEEFFWFLRDMAENYRRWRSPHYHLKEPLEKLALFLDTATRSMELQETVNMRDDQGRTVLHVAAMKNGNKEVIELLLKRAVEVDLEDKHARTALYWVARESGNEEIIALLVERGASVKALDDDQVGSFLE
jgi:Ankyrin repeats (3 copies)